MGESPEAVNMVEMLIVRSYIVNSETSYLYTPTTKQPISVHLSLVSEALDVLKFPTFQR